MSNKLFYSLAVCLLSVTLGFNVFKNSAGTIFDYSNPIYSFKLSSPSDQIGLASMLSFSVARRLDSTYYALKNIQSVFRTDKHIVVFDGETDYIERLCFFDLTTGKLDKEVQFPTKYYDDIASVRSVVYDAKQKKFYALASGRESILEYSSTGDLISELYIGMYGNKMVLLDDGTFLVESSLHEKGLSKGYRLVLFNQKGEIVDLYFPYQQREGGLSIEDTGILSKFDSIVHYSWPLGDTIYTFTNRVFSPEIIIDFEKSTIPYEKRSNPTLVTNNQFSEYSFVLSDFAATDDYLIFSYLNAGIQKNFELINKKTGSYLNARAALNDEFKTLFNSGDVLGMDGKTIIVELTPERARSLLKKRKDDIRLIQKNVPDLYRAIFQATQDMNPTLLYFNLKP